jgi:hypothetical protein
MLTAMGPPRRSLSHSLYSLEWEGDGGRVAPIGKADAEVGMHKTPAVKNTYVKDWRVEGVKRKELTSGVLLEVKFGGTFRGAG